MNKSTALLRLCSVRCCLWLLGALLLAGSFAQAGQIPAVGDILVADTAGGTNQFGALVLVNPVTGDRTILSDFGNPAQGISGEQFSLTSVALGHNGRIYTSVLFYHGFGGGAILKVDPQTGNRTLVSDFSQGTLQGYLYYGLAVDASGRLLANVQNTTNGIVRVDPETDRRVLISDITNPAQGETIEFLTDLALDHFGRILIGAILFDPNPNIDHSAIFQVNPTTGERKPVSDFTNPAQGAFADLFFMKGLAETSGRILANADPGLLSIDPETGNRTLLSDFSSNYLLGLGLEKSKDIIVGFSTGDPMTNSLYRVDPRTGASVSFSNSNNLAQGPPFGGFTYLAIVTPAQACHGNGRNGCLP